MRDLKLGTWRFGYIEVNMQRISLKKRINIGISRVLELLYCSIKVINCLQVLK